MLKAISKLKSLRKESFGQKSKVKSVSSKQLKAKKRPVKKGQVKKR
jgi:hypothetical protein